MRSDAEYRTYVTGLPEGAVFVMENPETGESFDFCGTDGPAVIWTIGVLGGLQDDGKLPRERAESYLGFAAYQMKVAGKTPIRWVCQRAEDAAALDFLLKDYEPQLKAVAGPGSIEVIAMVPPDEQAHPRA